MIGIYDIVSIDGPICTYELLYGIAVSDIYVMIDIYVNHAPHHTSYDSVWSWCKHTKAPPEGATLQCTCSPKDFAHTRVHVQNGDMQRSAADLGIILYIDIGHLLHRGTDHGVRQLPNRSSPLSVLCDFLLWRLEQRNGDAIGHGTALELRQFSMQ